MSAADTLPSQSQSETPLAGYRDLPEHAYYLEALEFMALMGIVAPGSEVSRPNSLWSARLPATIVFMLLPKPKHCLPYIHWR